MEKGEGDYTRDWTKMENVSLGFLAADGEKEKQKVAQFSWY